MLYQCVGSSFSSSWNFRCFVVGRFAVDTATPSSPSRRGSANPKEPTPQPRARVPGPRRRFARLVADDLGLLCRCEERGEGIERLCTDDQGGRRLACAALAGEV